MRAYQLTEPRSAEVREVDEPEPGPGEVLVEVTGAGVCHSDLHILHAEESLFPTPMTLGHEVAGTIRTVGEGVTGWEEGTPVLVHPVWGCGRCRQCVLGAENYCETYPVPPFRAQGSGEMAAWPSWSRCRLVTSSPSEISIRWQRRRSPTRA